MVGVRTAHRALLLAVALGLAGSPASARQAQQFGDYVVHYNAVLTEMIPPSVAREYGIRRSNERGLLNVAVEKQAGDGTPQSVPADIRVQATNLAEQVKEVELRAASSGDYTYYIGTFPVAEREVVNFALTIRPQGSDRAFELRFQSRFVSTPEFLEGGAR